MTSPQESKDPLEMWLFASILHCALGDTLWKTFRFKGRPRHGAFFDRFRSQQQVGEELFLFKEFMLVALVQAARAIYGNMLPRYAEHLLARVIELLVDGIAPHDQPWKVHFASRAEGAKFFCTGLTQYLSKESKDEVLVFMDRFLLSCGQLDLPRFLTCAAWMFPNQLPSLREGFDGRIRAAMVNHDTPVHEHAYVLLARDITRLF